MADEMGSGLARRLADDEALEYRWATAENYGDVGIEELTKACDSVRGSKQTKFTNAGAMHIAIIVFSRKLRWPNGPRGVSRLLHEHF